MAVGILLSLLAAYAADRFEQDRNFREARDRSGRVLAHLASRLAEFETVVRSAHSTASNGLTARILPGQQDISPHGHYPGLNRVRFLPEGCRNASAPAEFPAEWAEVSGREENPELSWHLPVYRVGAPLETPEQRRAACVGVVEAYFEPRPLFIHLFDDPAMMGLSVRSVTLILSTDGGARLVPLYAQQGPAGTLLSHDEIAFLGNDLVVQLAGASADDRIFRRWGRAVFGAGLMVVFAVVGLLGFIRSRYEQRLSETERALERYTRIAAMGELAAAIAHEVAQPLTGVITCLEAAQLRAAGKQADTEGWKELAKALEHAERAADILDDIRRHASATQETQNTQLLTVDETLRRVAEMARLDARYRTVDISVQGAGREHRVMGSRVGLESVLLNLLRNSAEAITTTGLGGAVSLGASVADARVLIRIDDDGPGLPDPSHVFLPFRSTKPAGMGLGLCYCRRAVEAVGGTLNGGNRPNGGAYFEISLPLASAVLSEAGKTPHEALS
ncbi:HAMP domain-containing histidine kinase [Methylococcus sp. EFPC2]|nr:HAMP domain-containing histidine kinase [Methylococcus sp. EFPC2]